jgi:hypothetical protein
MKITILWVISFFLTGCVSTDNICLKKDSGHFSIQGNTLIFSATGCDGEQHEWLIQKIEREVLL